MAHDVVVTEVVNADVEAAAAAAAVAAAEAVVVVVATAVGNCSDLVQLVFPGPRVAHVLREAFVSERIVGLMEVGNQTSLVEDG